MTEPTISLDLEGADSYGRIRHILSEIPFFEDFGAQDLEFFARNLSLRSCPAGTILFQRGDIGDYLFFIVDGLVEVRIESSDQKKVIIGSFGRGCTIGEMSLLDDYPRSATVQVTQPTELLLLSRHRFDSICTASPVVGFKFLKGLARNLSERLRKTNGRFADLS